HFVEICGTSLLGGDKITPFDRALAARLSQLGAAEYQLVQLLGRLADDRPDLMPQLRYSLFFYCQARYLLNHYGFWDPELAKPDLPLAPKPLTPKRPLNVNLSQSLFSSKSLLALTPFETADTKESAAVTKLVVSFCECRRALRWRCVVTVRKMSVRGRV